MGLDTGGMYDERHSDDRDLPRLIYFAVGERVTLRNLKVLFRIRQSFALVKL